MKSILLSFLLFIFVATVSNAQNKKFEVYIQKTGTIVEDDVEVDVSSDDAEQENDEMDDLYDDDLDVGYEYVDASEINIVNIGLRFRGITIPAGSVIDSAFLYVHSHEGKSAEDVALIKITGENNANPETFSMDALITDRPRTSASVNWEVAEEWGLYTKHRSPDIKNIIQEIISLEGWSAGNSLAIIMEGQNQGVSDRENAREIESFENIADPEDGGDGQNHPERVPQLVVYFKSGTSTSVQSQRIDNKVMIYPNPIENGLLHIRFNSKVLPNINIYSITGKRVKSAQLESASGSINVSDLNKGMYIIHFSDLNETVSSKIILK